MTSLLQISEFDFGEAVGESAPPLPLFFPLWSSVEDILYRIVEGIDTDERFSAGSDCLLDIARADIMNG